MMKKYKFIKKYCKLILNIVKYKQIFESGKETTNE